MRRNGEAAPTDQTKLWDVDGWISPDAPSVVPARVQPAPCHWAAFDEPNNCGDDVEHPVHVLRAPMSKACFLSQRGLVKEIAAMPDEERFRVRIQPFSFCPFRITISVASSSLVSSGWTEPRNCSNDLVTAIAEMIVSVSCSCD